MWVAYFLSNSGCFAGERNGNLAKGSLETIIAPGGSGNKRQTYRWERMGQNYGRYWKNPFRFPPEYSHIYAERTETCNHQPYRWEGMERKSF